MVPALIARHEAKFRVAPDIVPALTQDLLKFCQIDPNAITDGEGLYTIDSLYFDNDRWQLFWLSEEGAAIRTKIRVRRYLGPQGPAPTVKLEVKRKQYAIVTKTSATVPAAHWAAAVKSPRAQLAQPSAAERNAYNVFAIECARTRAVPKLLVRYRRLALSSQVDDYVRITIDRQIQYQDQRALSLSADPRRWRHGDDAGAMQGQSRLIMEVKFQRSAPQWLVAIIRRYGLHESGFSKYGNAMRRELIERPDRDPQAPKLFVPGRGLTPRSSGPWPA